MHVVVSRPADARRNLGASHYSQYLGMSAGVTALVLGAQPLVTAVIAATLLNETAPARAVGRRAHRSCRRRARGVAQDRRARAITAGATASVLIALAAITVGHAVSARVLPHRRPARGFCRAIRGDRRRHGATRGRGGRRAASVFGWPLVAALAFLVIFASILAVQRAAHVDAPGRSDTGHQPVVPDTYFRGRTSNGCFSPFVPTALTVAGNRRHLHRCLPVSPGSPASRVRDPSRA